jgi:hypothetical protein
MTDSTTSTVRPTFFSASTALVFLLSLGSLPRSIPERTHEMSPIPKPLVAQVSSSTVSSSYVYSMTDRIDILSSFVSKLMLQSVDLKPEAVEAINDHFWELF